MTQHIFLSHSHLDKSVADLVLNCLESRGIRCWVAPRDVSAGGSYAASIVDAIENAHSLILIYTINCNTSPHVLREVERALHVGLNIIPVRFDDSTPSKSLNYLLATVHWLSVGGNSRNIDVAKAVDRIALTLEKVSQTGQLASVKAAEMPLAFGPPAPKRREIFGAGSNRILWLALAPALLFGLGLASWYVVSPQRAIESPPTIHRLENTTVAPADVTPRVRVAPTEVPWPTPISTPEQLPIREAVPLTPLPDVQPKAAEEAALKGSWVQVVQQKKSHTVDIHSVKLVLNGDKFVFTRSTKCNLRRDVPRPREAPKGVTEYSHVTRYSGEVIFRNKDMIKIKLLSVDFPMRYPGWVSGAKRMEQNDADYVVAKAVWTLRWVGGNLVDAEEATTILRPER